MGSIRVGLFHDFKGADTLLLAVDHEGLQSLIAWLREVIASGRIAAFSDCPGASVQPRLRISVARGSGDVGLSRVAETEFVWRRSEAGWLEIIEKLEIIGPEGHQYLEGPRDAVQVMASIGEYGDEWWQRHGP
ncbi:MAG TPA: hypothetical protein VF424_16620 [Vicinamibacterales bacterium]